MCEALVKTEVKWSGRISTHPLNDSDVERLCCEQSGCRKFSFIITVTDHMSQSSALPREVQFLSNVSVQL